MLKEMPSLEDIRRDFHKIYYSDILPLMCKYENDRQFELLKLFIKEAIILFVVIILGYYQYLRFASGKPLQDIYVIFMVILVVIMPVISYVDCTQFAELLKRECMPKILEAFGNMRWYNKKAECKKTKLINTDNQLAESNLFSVYNRRSYDDSFEGCYKGVKFGISETTLVYESGSGKNKRIELVFKGVIINFDSNKTIKNKTIIATKNDSKIKNSYVSISTIIILAANVILGVVLQSWNLVFYCGLPIVLFLIFAIIQKSNKNMEILNEIKLEDPEFNKKYKAYSSDEVEGRYLITPAFMERFNNIKTAFGAKKVKCSFYGKSLMFAISSHKNLFEIGNLFTPLNSPKQLQVFSEELISILALIDYFKLDEKTGL